MQFVVKFQLDENKTVDDAVITLKSALRNRNGADQLQVGETGHIYNSAGEYVGTWEVTAGLE